MFNILSLLFIFLVLPGGLFCIWYGYNKMLPKMWQNAHDYAGNIPSLSLGFVYLLIAGLIFWLASIAEAEKSLPIVLAYLSLMISAIGVFVPHFFVKDEDATWSSLPYSMKIFSKMLMSAWFWVLIADSLMLAARFGKFTSFLLTSIGLFLFFAVLHFKESLAKDESIFNSSVSPVAVKVHKFNTNLSLIIAIFAYVALLTIFLYALIL